MRQLDPAADDESGLAGVREGHLASLFTQAGLGLASVTTLTVRVRHASFDDWWEPFTLGVGPAGAYVASLTPVTGPRCASSASACSRSRPGRDHRHRLGGYEPNLRTPSRTCAEG